MTGKDLEPAEAKTAIPIYKVRDIDVVLDADLARLYGIETKRLNEQVKRNAERFEGGFAFQATKEDAEALRSQIATSNEEQGRGGRRSLPWVFTEHGVAMAASVVNSPRAIEAMRLAKPGLENTELAARAAKLLAEAEAIAFSTIVKTLHLLLEAEKAMRAESPDAFLALLRELTRACWSCWPMITPPPSPARLPSPPSPFPGSRQCRSFHPRISSFRATDTTGFVSHAKNIGSRKRDVDPVSEPVIGQDGAPTEQRDRRRESTVDKEKVSAALPSGSWRRNTPADPRSEATRLREVLDGVEATLAAGASHVAALATLHAQGVGHALPPTVSLRAPDGLTRFAPAETGLWPRSISPI